MAEKTTVDTVPCVHMAFINAIALGHYAFEPLEPKTGRNAWQLCLEKLTLLPARQFSSQGKLQENVECESSKEKLPCICLLPPRAAVLPPRVAEALEQETLRQQGLYPVYLADYSETALLTAVRQGIEAFYPQAFRPDETVAAVTKFQQKYLHSRHGQSEGNTGQPQINGAATPPPLPFVEDVTLPLSMRRQPEQLNCELAPKNITSRQIHCYWLDAAAPMFLEELTRQLYEAHHRGAAELSFADTYPVGLVPLLFQVAIMGRLWLLRRQPQTVGAVKVDKLNIWEIAARDLNLFAAEPLLSPKDYRLLRLDLRANSKRQYQFLQNLYRDLSAFLLPSPANCGTEDTVDIAEFSAKILPWIEDSNQSRRGLPCYFPVQISALCPQQCSYCPYPQLVGREFFPPLSLQSLQDPQSPQRSQNTTFMARSLWRKLLAAIVEFAGDGVINLSPLGEPLLHPEFFFLIEDLQLFPALELVIETSGSHWAAANIRQLRGHSTWIVSLDALDPKLYRQLRAPNENISPLTGMTASQQKAHELVELLLQSGQSVYVQAVRMEANEADLEAFYRYWAEGRKPTDGDAALALKNWPERQIFPQVLVQKYNSYAGLLPQRHQLRLEPERRFPCRRLEREMVFALDGRVHLCVQDLRQELAGQLKQSLGTFPQQNLEELWHCGQELYQWHLDGNYPAMCKNCDEYYVHNF